MEADRFWKRDGSGSATSSLRRAEQDERLTLRSRICRQTRRRGPSQRASSFQGACAAPTRDETKRGDQGSEEDLTHHDSLLVLQQDGNQRVELQYPPRALSRGQKRRRAPTVYTSLSPAASEEILHARPLTTPDRGAKRVKRQQNQQGWSSQRLDKSLSRRGRRARSGTLVEQDKLA